MPAKFEATGNQDYLSAKYGLGYGGKNFDVSGGISAGTDFRGQPQLSAAELNAILRLFGGQLGLSASAPIENYRNPFLSLYFNKKF